MVHKCQIFIISAFSRETWHGCQKKFDWSLFFVLPSRLSMQAPTCCSPPHNFVNGKTVWFCTKCGVQRVRPLVPKRPRTGPPGEDDFCLALQLPTPAQADTLGAKEALFRSAQQLHTSIRALRTTLHFADPMFPSLARPTPHFGYDGKLTAKTLNVTTMDFVPTFGSCYIQF